MNELQTRLAKLRQHAGTTANAMTGVSAEALAAGNPAIGQRLRQLAAVARTAEPSRQRMTSAELAELLNGQLIGDGLIVVEQLLPLGTQHGRHRIDSDAVEAALRFFGFDGSAVFMDTETTGLAGGTGTLVFMLGLGRFARSGLLLKQYFLTDFKSEPLLLEHAQEFIKGAQSLVTYNGKNFDHPLLKTRYRLSGMTDPFAALQHLDLLHTTRRAYSNRWSDCRLRTAEENLLGFNRVDDLPGSEAPETWFNWIRHGVTDNLPGVFHHNAWDIISLAAMLPALHASFVDPQENKADILASARHYLRDGDEQKAYTVLLSNRTCLERQALLELARLSRHNGDWASSIEIWHDLVKKGDTQATEHLAKYYEHKIRDYAQALESCRKLIQTDTFAARHRHREQRLLTKIRKSTPH